MHEEYFEAMVAAIFYLAGLFLLVSYLSGALKGLGLDVWLSIIPGFFYMKYAKRVFIYLSKF